MSGASAPLPSTDPPGDRPADPVAAVLILAAGAGTRMRSALPKVMHPLAGRPLLWHALRAAGELAPERMVAVVGHGRDRIETFLAGADDLAHLPISTVVQPRQRGTGDAVRCALAATGPVTGTVVVSYGDVPLLTGATLAALVRAHAEAGNGVTVLTARPDDPTGYGRVLRDADGAVTAIVEQRDADAATAAITEINTGVYAFDGQLLGTLIGRLSDDNAQGEAYLTEVVQLAAAADRAVGAVLATDPTETEGVNDRVQLAAAEARLRSRLVRSAQRNGVSVVDPATTYLDIDVAIGPDTVLEPGVHLRGGTRIGSGCVIGPDTTLESCVVDDDATVVRSHCTDARIRHAARVGPYTHLRPGSDIGAHCQVGAYVEVKKAVLGEGTKSHHLAYLGDAEIGAGANIGAGVITANYDGARKYRTTIGADAFIGTNVTLVAPVTVGDGAFVAAGSTVTTDVDPGDLAVARGRQRSIAGWVLRRRPDSAGARAAQAAQAAQAASAARAPGDTGADTPEGSAAEPSSYPAGEPTAGRARQEGPHTP